MKISVLQKKERGRSKTMKNVKMSGSAKKEVFAIACVFVAAACIIFGGAVKLSQSTVTKTGTYENSIAFGGQDILSDELGTYINNYFVKNGVTEYMTEEEEAQLIAEISAGVLNSLPASNVSEEDMTTIRTLITTSVQAQAAKYNADKEATATSAVLTPELEEYINSTVVPNLTAQVQMYNGETEDLKESLEAISAGYIEDKAAYDKLINSVSTQLKEMDIKAASEEEVDAVKKDLASLSKVLVNYKSLQAADLTSIKEEIAALNVNLQTQIDDLSDSVDALSELTDVQLLELKNSLTQQITANSQLSDNQKQELMNSIDTLSAENVKNLADAKEYLQNYADTVNANLSSAIESLEIKASDTLDETKTQLMQQITENEQLSESQRKMLEDMINDLDETTGESIESIQTYLAEQLGIQTTNLSNAVSDLQSTIDTLSQKVNSLEGQLNDLTTNTLVELKGNLQSQINANKNLTESQRQELLNKINDLDALTTSELSSQVALLQEEIAQESSSNSAALNSAIVALYGGADGSTTIADLLSQIDSNADLTAAQKVELQELITNKYDALDDTISVNVASLQSDLSNEVTARNTAINTAVTDLRTSLTSTIDALSNTVDANKAASDAADANLQSQIDALNSSFSGGLGGVAISYHDGHFYATSPDGTVKKLDYAE